jgi:hypothetical protein
VLSNRTRATQNGRKRAGRWAPSSGGWGYSEYHKGSVDNVRGRSCRVVPTLLGGLVFSVCAGWCGWFYARTVVCAAECAQHVVRFASTCLLAGRRIAQGAQPPAVPIGRETLGLQSTLGRSRHRRNARGGGGASCGRHRQRLTETHRASSPRRPAGAGDCGTQAPASAVQSAGRDVMQSPALSHEKPRLDPTLTASLQQWKALPLAGAGGRRLPSRRLVPRRRTEGLRTCMAAARCEALGTG